MGLPEWEWQIQIYEKGCTLNSEENSLQHMFKTCGGFVGRSPVSNALKFQDIHVISVCFRLILSFRCRCLFVPEMFVTFKFYVIYIIFTYFSHVL
jgi:hypothetical protein